MPTYKNQHTYQSNKSSKTALQLIIKIETVLGNQEIAPTEFLCILVAAFDKTSFEAITLVLTSQAVVGNIICRWTKNT